MAVIIDPWSQTFPLADEDGNTLEVSMTELSARQHYVTSSAINYGTQVGASFMLLLVLLLLTKAAKRRSYIFLVNGFCLLINTIRCILLASLLTSNWYNPYTQLSGDYSRLTRGNISVSVSTVILTLVVAILVFVSLGIQVWVVCVTTSPLQRAVIMTATTIIGTVALGYRIALAVFNIQAVLTQTEMGPHERFVSDCYVVQAVAIWFYSCVFTYKLGNAIFQRRRLNMPQFGPMQIVFIMGCQTMIIPAIFTVLQFVPEAPELGNQVLTVVCLFLPLSAIWAGIDKEASIASRGADSHHKLFNGEFSHSTVRSTGTNSSSHTAYDGSRKMSAYAMAKSKDKNDIENMSAHSSPHRRSEIKDGNIRIDREYGFSGEDATY